jgi:anion-transporting  ArsA/GET3 family ATPase
MTTTLVFTGSSGPGIATAAAALALRAADAGRRTLLLGLGDAAGLGALLGTAPGGNAPLPIAPNLDALAIDVSAELSAAWERGRSRAPGQLAQVAGDELPIPPALELFFGLLRLRELAPHYELAIVEAGAHDMLLRALALPDGLRWAVRLLFGLDRGPGRSSASVGRAVVPTSFMPVEALDRVQEARLEAARARDVLASASMRYVLRPDPAGLESARLAVPALQLHGLAVPALLAGPLLPGDLSDARLAPIAAQQRATLAEAAAAWPARALARFELIGDNGLAALRVVGSQLAVETDLLGLSAPAPIAEVHGGEPAVAVELPGMPKGALRLTLSGDELIMQVGPYRRHILLPEGLRGAGIRATREGEWVIVRRR